MNNFVYFFGIVEDRNDPEMLGRCRVRIFGVHSENKDELPTFDLPWAYPILPVNNAAMSGIGQTVTGPVNGTQVFGFFRDGQDMQEPVIMGTIAGKYESKPLSSEGFGDPTGIFPIFDVDKNDVNRLERGVIEKTHVDFKIQNMTTAKITSNISATGERESSSWLEEFETSPIYPFNHVKETESGHIDEWDDTPGFERINRMHRSGTSDEVYANGDKTIKVYGNEYHIVVEDNNVAIYGKCNVTIGDNANILVGGNVNLEVNGNMSSIIRGDENKIVYGNSIERVSGNITRVSGGDIQDKGNNINTHANENIISRAGGYNYVQASGNVELQGELVHLIKPTPLVDIFTPDAIADNVPLNELITPTDLKDYVPRQGQTLARTYVTIDPTEEDTTNNLSTYPSGTVYPITTNKTIEEVDVDEDTIIENTLRREGGFIANDAGRGPSKYGVLISSLATYRGVSVSSLTAQDVRNLTIEEAIAIYKKNYWDAINVGQAPAKVREILFDTNVNGGAGSVTRAALISLGVDIPANGGVTKTVIAAMNSVNVDDLYDAMVKARVARYYRLVQNNPKLKVYINGWLNRMKDFGWSPQTA